MATETTYGIIGAKVDVSDVISNISPTTTPFTQNIGSAGKPKQVLFSWQEDILNPVESAPQIEGANARAATVKTTNMRSNVTQIFERTASVSRTVDKTEFYGRPNELAYQLKQRGAELKRDYEYACVGTGQQMNAGSPTVGRMFAGFQAQVDSTVTFVMNASGGALAAAGATAATVNAPAIGTSGAAAITEFAVVSLQQALYNNGADPDTLMVKPADAIRISNFTAQGRVVQHPDSSTKLTANITIYESPFGSLKVVKNRFLRGNNAGDTISDALMYENAQWKTVALDPWNKTELAVTGLNRNVMLSGEYSLKGLNHLASGVITGLIA